MAVKLDGYFETGVTTAKGLRFRGSDGAFWSTAGTPAFEAYNAANIANYGIAGAEVGATGRYTFTDPAETVPGSYLIVKAAGASLVALDLADGRRWEGSAGPITGLAADAVADIKAAITNNTLDVSAAGEVQANVLKWAGEEVLLGTIGGAPAPAVYVGNIGGNIITAATIAAGAIGASECPSLTTIMDKTNLIPASPAAVGDIPTAAANAAAVLAAGDVDGFTLEQTLKLCLAALAGKLSGAATTTIIIRAADDSKARITATVDTNGNRSAITHDATG